MDPENKNQPITDEPYNTVGDPLSQPGQTFSPQNDKSSPQGTDNNNPLPSSATAKNTFDNKAYLPIEKNHRNSKITLIIVGVFSLLVLLGAMGFFAYKAFNNLNSKEKEHTASLPTQEVKETPPTTIQKEETKKVAPTYASADEERKAEIDIIFEQLKEYYNQNGHYPSLANMNDKAFRTANFKTLSQEVFKDPKGSSASFIGSLDSDNKTLAYRYRVRSADYKPCEASAKTCQSLIMEALLDNRIACSNCSSGSTDAYTRSATKGRIYL